MEAFEGPAYLATATFDILAWNSALCAVFGDLRPLPPRERNVLWLMFANATYRAAIPNWEEAARAVLARFRVQFGRERDDARFTELIERLHAASSEFRAWWREHDVTPAQERSKRFGAPGVGELELEQSTFHLEQAPELRLVLYAPADQDSARKVARLRQRWRRNGGAQPDAAGRR